MLKTVLAIAVLIAPLPAAAQQTLENEEKCLNVVVLETRVSMRNKCGYALSMDAMYADLEFPLRHTLKPDDEISYERNTFGTACRDGYASEIKVTLANRAEIRKGTYRCVKK